MKLTVQDAKRYWREAGVDPAAVSFSGASIARGEPTPEDLSGLTSALMSKGTGGAQHAQAMLIAALGTTVTHRILDKSQLRERWSRLLEILQSDSPSSQELSQRDAGRLSQELCSEAAQALRQGLAESFRAPGALDEAIAAARGGGLSFRAIHLIVKDLLPHLGAATQQRMNDLLREVRIEEELRGLFKNAGDATYLRDVPVSALLRDEALFLDGFEVFIEANDKALKLITEMSQSIADALQDGRDFAAHSNGASLSEMTDELRAEVSRMLDWFENMGAPDAAAKCKAAFESVTEKLVSAADDLERILSTGYHQLGGFDFHQDSRGRTHPRLHRRSLPGVHRHLLEEQVVRRHGQHRDHRGADPSAPSRGGARVW